MPNMSYCRFQNTSSDLYDCDDHIQDGDLSEEEFRARMQLINTCSSIFGQLGIDFSKEDLDNAKEELRSDYEYHLED